MTDCANQSQKASSYIKNRIVCALENAYNDCGNWEKAFLYEITYFLWLFWKLFLCFKGDFFDYFCIISFTYLVILLLVHSYIETICKTPKLKVVSIVLSCSVKKTNCPITNFGIVWESHISLRAFPHIAWSVQEVSCVSVRGDLGEDFSFSYK